MNLITDAEFEAILSAIGAIDDYDQSVELMKMTVELGVHRASRVVSGNLGLRLSFPENPDSTLQRTGEQVFTSFSPDEPVRPSSDPQHAGDSGLDAVSTDDPAPISSTTPHAGDSEVRSPSADDPAPILSSSPIKKGESEGGSPALHPFGADAPLLHTSGPWNAKYTPDQCFTFWLCWAAGQSVEECAIESGLTFQQARDIIKHQKDRGEWLRAQDAATARSYLAEMHKINTLRLKRAVMNGVARCNADKRIPVPAATEPAVAAQPEAPPRTSLRDFNEDEFNASAFGPPPVPRSPGATARRIALTADLILNKANTEQNK